MSYVPAIFTLISPIFQVICVSKFDSMTFSDVVLETSNYGMGRNK